MNEDDAPPHAPRKKRGSGRTGPLTAGGRLASSRNALKHGLDVELGRLATYAGPATALAKLLMCGGAGAALAQPLAEALLDVVRIREARHRALLALAGDLQDAQFPAVFDRYERRALSRRRRLIRALE